MPSENEGTYSSKLRDVSRGKNSNQSSIVLESHLPSRFKSTRREYDFNSSVVVVFPPELEFLLLVHFFALCFASLIFVLFSLFLFVIWKDTKQRITLAPKFLFHQITHKVEFFMGGTLISNCVSFWELGCSKLKKQLLWGLGKSLDGKHETIIRAGITCKKIPCSRLYIAENAKTFTSYVLMLYANKFTRLLNCFSWPRI